MVLVLDPSKKRFHFGSMSQTWIILGDLGAWEKTGFSRPSVDGGDDLWQTFGLIEFASARACKPAPARSVLEEIAGDFFPSAAMSSPVLTKRREFSGMIHGSSLVSCHHPSNPQSHSFPTFSTRKMELWSWENP